MSQSREKTMWLTKDNGMIGIKYKSSKVTWLQPGGPAERAGLEGEVAPVIADAFRGAPQQFEVE
eukprot:gene40003-63594_t